ncbi:ubiquitin-conjugating enzyme [Schizopora paradoxa]|uniref:Ubiquitin-conjugating enzyme n=1 Tax=Schizopora paradoxa TaxID=27342 RepID=A0A0H2RX23_9AGAM|nr:ubiquitin-conjugating enzyme [Schizopora paradoxa]
MNSTSGTTNASNTLLLRRQLQELKKDPPESFSVGLIDDSNMFEWAVSIWGPDETLYEGAILKATLHFPPDFPLRPPKMKFKSEMWHPNIYKDGTVCISILHEPGEDVYGYEQADERWRPVLGVAAIIQSVLSMLTADQPNLESPANVDAAVQVRDDPKGYKRKVRRLAQKTLEEE